MDVSIIIVNYNTKELTAACINSIFQYTEGVEFEVILVDNASTDGSREFFRKDTRIILIESEINLGFGRANNLGYEYSHGKYVFLLNSDTYLLNNAVKIFYDRMSVLPQTVACLGCMLSGPDGRYSHSYGDYLRWRNAWQSVLVSAFGRDDSVIRSTDLPIEGTTVPVIIGADLFIRRKVIEQEGFFDPIFFMYHEENDLQKRYGLAGYECRIVPGPEIVHLEGGNNPYKINILSTKGNFLFIKKWYSYPQYLSYRVVYALTHFPKIFIRQIPWEQRVLYLRILLFYRVRGSKNE